MRKEVERLEHHADLRVEPLEPRRWWVERSLVEKDFAPVRPFQAIEAAQQRALARSTRAAQHNHLAGGDGKADTPEHLHRAKGFLDIADVNGWWPRATKVGGLGHFFWVPRSRRLRSQGCHRATNQHVLALRPLAETLGSRAHNGE